MIQACGQILLGQRDNDIHTMNVSCAIGTGRPIHAHLASLQTWLRRGYDSVGGFRFQKKTYKNNQKPVHPGKLTAGT